MAEQESDGVIDGITYFSAGLALLLWGMVAEGLLAVAALGVAKILYVWR